MECNYRDGSTYHINYYLYYLDVFYFSFSANICHHPLNIGIPRIPITRQTYYYYNSTANKCDWFYYYGLGGNDNRFEDISSCQERCGMLYNVHVL